MRWPLLFLLAALAGVPPSEKGEILARFAEEQLGEVLADHILRLTLADAPTRPRYVVPVRNTWVKPAVLTLYVYRSGERPLALSDPRGSELRSLKGEDKNGDGLTDLVVTVRLGNKERTVWYRNDGAAGFQLVTGARPDAPKSVSGRADCGPLPLAKPWSLKACPVPGNRFDLVFAAEGRERYRLSGTGDTFEVQGFDERAVAVSFEGTECQVVKVIRLKDGKVVADTDCANATYCAVTRFPGPGECEGLVECGDGGGGFRWKRPFAVCP